MEKVVVLADCNCFYRFADTERQFRRTKGAGNKSRNDHTGVKDTNRNGTTGNNGNRNKRTGNGRTGTDRKGRGTGSRKNIDDIGAYFSVSDVRNDVTGNWRISTIAENVDIQEYALSYYKEYFKDDKEIHAIVNFNYKTTTKISVIGNTLDVSIYDYVDGEEHDAKLLFSGTLLKEYSVNMDNGSIEEIQ